MEKEANPGPSETSELPGSPVTPQKCQLTMQATLTRWSCPPLPRCRPVTVYGQTSGLQNDPELDKAESAPASSAEGWGCSPGMAAGAGAGPPPSSSVSEAKTMFVEGSADFWADFPVSRWVRAFLDEECGTEFTTLPALVCACTCREVRGNTGLEQQTQDTECNIPL